MRRNIHHSLIFLIVNLFLALIVMKIEILLKKNWLYSTICRCNNVHTIQYYQYTTCTVYVDVVTLMVLFFYSLCFVYLRVRRRAAKRNNPTQLSSLKDIQRNSQLDVNYKQLLEQIPADDQSDLY